MKKKLWLPVLIVIIITVGIILAIQNNNSSLTQEQIKIGAILPLTGDLASYGNDVLKGINLFAEEHANLEVLVEDDQGDSKESISAMIKLRDINGVSYFVGPFGPIPSEAIYSSQTDEEKNNLTFEAVSMCSDEFQNYDNMICTYPSPYYQLKASYIYLTTIGKESFYAILSNDASGESIYQMFFQIADEIGLKMLDASKINVSDSDFYTVIDKTISQNPDFVVVATLNQGANLKIVKELKEKGYAGMIMSGGDFNEDLVKEYQDILENVYLTGQAKFEYDENFVSAFTEKYDLTEPNMYQAYGYMWIEVLYNLAEQNPDQHFTIDDIVEYVNSHADDLAIKGFKYDADKKVEFPMKVMLAKDGKLEEIFVSK